MSETNKKAPTKGGEGKPLETDPDRFLTYDEHVRRYLNAHPSTGPISGGIPDATGDSTLVADDVDIVVRQTLGRSIDGKWEEVRPLPADSSKPLSFFRNDPSPEKPQNPNSKCRS